MVNVTSVTTAFIENLDLHGADVIRAEMALLVAGELDDEDTPRHSIPRLTAQLRTLIADLERAPLSNGRRVSADRLLADVLR
jgi:hypothetical protein